jgi:uncharacterized membrane protein
VPKLLALWKQLSDSLWFLPAVMTLGGAVAALVLVRSDAFVLGDTPAREFSWLFAGTAEGARGMLSAITSSIITVTGVVFSVTIVALQLASQQFTPRILRQFMSDRANQLVLGVFIGTFTYTLLVQRTVRSPEESADAFVPSVAITMAVVFALVSIGFLIFFIDHAARSIQANTIMARVTRETLDSFPRVAQADDRDVAELPADVVPAAEPAIVRAHRSDYITGLDYGRLVELARRHDLLLGVEHRVGAFVMEGVPLLRVWGGASSAEAVHGELRDAYVFGPGRTPHQDPEIGIIELVDIAVKALSPGINDPTTATMAIDRLGQLVRAIGSGRPAARARRDEDGRIRLILPAYEFAHMVGMAFDQIRHYGVSNPTVAIKLVTTMGAVAALVGERERPVLVDAIRHTLAAAEAAVQDPRDLEHVRAAAVAAIAESDDEGNATGSGHVETS